MSRGPNVDVHLLSEHFATESKNTVLYTVGDGVV